MPIDQGELARRLRAARDEAGMTQDQAATAVGVSRPAIAQVEAGRRSVSGLELDQLATLYGKDIRDLLGTRPVDGDVFAHFRPDAEAIGGAAVLERLAECQRSGRDLRDLESSVGGDRPATVSYDLRVSVFPHRARAQGTEVAEAERRRLALGDAPIADLVGLLRANGVRTAELQMPDDVSGLTLAPPDLSPLIVANRCHGVSRRMLSFAREYGHVLLDRARHGSVTRYDEDEEQERDPRDVRAEAFANSFLMPEAGLRRYVSGLGRPAPERRRPDAGAGQRQVQGSDALGPVDLHDLVLLAHAYKVTRPVMASRLHAIRAISTANLQDLWRREARSGRSTARLLGIDAPEETDPTGERPDTRLAKAALEAFRSGRIDRETLISRLRHAAIGLSDAQMSSALDEGGLTPGRDMPA